MTTTFTTEITCMLPLVETFWTHYASNAILDNTYVQVPEEQIQADSRQNKTCN